MIKWKIERGMGEQMQQIVKGFNEVCLKLFLFTQDSLYNNPLSTLPSMRIMLSLRNTYKGTYGISCDLAISTAEGLCRWNELGTLSIQTLTALNYSAIKGSLKEPDVK